MKTDIQIEKATPKLPIGEIAGSLVGEAVGAPFKKIGIDADPKPWGDAKGLPLKRSHDGVQDDAGGG